MADQRSTERESDFSKPGRGQRKKNGKRNEQRGESGPKEHYHRERFTAKDVYNILDENGDD